VAKHPHIWTICEQDRARTRSLAEGVGIPPIVAHLLILRGIEDPEEARLFLEPNLSHLSDPFLLTDMDVAIKRITLARDNEEHVRIFGDYDVDGITGTAVLLNGLKRFGIEQLSHAMPQRLTEGYGISAAHVDAARDDGVSLLITVDNGINAHEAGKRAAELGIDLIITDHHTLDETLPTAVAVINPKRENSDYAGINLCGAGVAFKLTSALNGTPNDLDIAALGTVADIVPLVGENRTIVSLGLRHMVKYARTGLEKLADRAGVNLKEITSEQIGFQIGPRLNAAGRLDDGLVALKLLMAECPDEAGEMAALLNDANEERRAIERSIVDDAKEELDAFFAPAMRSIVVSRRGWHPGVIGIVASRLQHHYNRPVFVIGFDEEGIGRGSGRSGGGFDIIGAITNCQQYLERFGGHKAAAGLTIREEHIDAFRAAFEAEALQQLGSGELIPELSVDVLATLSEIDSALLKVLEQLEPLGQHNPSPVFCSLDVELVPNSIRILKDQHLKLSVRQGDAVLPAIGFGMAERYYLDGLADTFDIAYTPKFNTWRGETSVQLLLKDIRQNGKS
jgi:single-stranded-DNA-specific exonuclease